MLDQHDHPRNNNTSTVRVAVLGAGYVGLRVAAAMIDQSRILCIYDSDPAKLAALGSDGTLSHSDATALADAVTARTCTTRDITGGLRPFDVAVVCVPTPLTQGTPDTSHIAAAADLIGSALQHGSLVILESTSWPGTTQRLFVPRLEAASSLKAGIDFHVAYSPERVDPGNSRWTLPTTPKVVAGLTKRCATAAARFYGSFLDTVVMVDDVQVAEFAKLVENTYRFVNVSLVNELATVAADLGIDFSAVLEAAATKPFGFDRFDPGPGAGGHCIPVDPIFLRDHVRTTLRRDLRMVTAAAQVNDDMPSVICHRVVNAVGDSTGSLSGCTVLLAGLAYKRDVRDSRGSVAHPLAQALQALGAAVHCIDHLVSDDGLPQGTAWADLPGMHRTDRRYDATVFLTVHTDLDVRQLLAASRWSLDCRGIIAGATEQLASPAHGHA